MKKSLVALAVLGTLAGTAAAQSSVTLFGVVDAAARYVESNGQSISSLASGGISTSRFGVRGEEDLGGGLKAGFWLESTVGTDNGGAGDGTRFWDRRASVSLISRDWGEARLGRGKTAERLVIDDFDPHSTTGLGAITNVYSSLNSGVQNMNRADNQAAYHLPSTLGGLYGTLDVGAGEAVDGKKYYGGRIGYKAGPWHVAGGYQTTETQGDDYEMGSIAGSWDFGFIRASLLYTNTKFRSSDQDIYTLGAIMPLGAGELKASWTEAAGSGPAVGDASMYAVSYTYNLSKRTALYTAAALINNDAPSRFALPGSPTVVSGGRSGGVDVGVRHSF
jgi:predicted porin